jgi:hypothetical protein
MGSRPVRTGFRGSSQGHGRKSLVWGTQPGTTREMELTTFFDLLWDDFTSIAPAAASIRSSLAARGESVSNDHVAFRTFDRGPIRLERLEPLLLGLGYERFAPYAFEKKRLKAFGYVHPDPSAPRVFLSELETQCFSGFLRDIVDRLVAQVSLRQTETPAVFWSGRPWDPVSRSEYERLADESEYAAWVAALGLHANHFTVSVNELSEELRSIEAVLAWVESLGFGINESGGRVKGSPELLLEQGSTLADEVEVPFEDGARKVPAGYCEFALRHRDAQARLYPGFVPQSADRIFESTDRR